MSKQPTKADWKRAAERLAELWYTSIDSCPGCPLLIRDECRLDIGIGCIKAIIAWALREE